jgi:hypothetical protein
VSSQNNSIGGSTRDPPAWVPVAALLTLPALLVSAAVGGAFDQRWALTALVIGVFAFVFLAGWWAAPNSSRALVLVAVVSVTASLTLVAGVVAISAVAEHNIPKRNTPATTVTTSVESAPSSDSSPASTTPN